MTDFETHPAGTADLVKRLRQRADQNRAIQKNNEAVASALIGQRLLFDQGIRSDANTFAVSLWLDYEICAKKDAKLSQDWGDAADSIEQLEAAHRAVMEEHDYTAKRLGHAFERIDRQAETIDKLTARANAATAAAYEVAAQMVETTAYTSNGDTRSLEPVAAGLSGMDMHHATIATAIRALATPDQTAALDKLIAEAVEPLLIAAKSGLRFIENTESELGIILGCGDSLRNAILAASKKGGV